MKTALPSFVVLLFALGVLSPRPIEAQSYEAIVVDASTQVLHEIMAVPMRQIPQSLLAGAQGIAIIPNLIKGGFIVGVRHGRGVVVVRDETGAWRPPVFVTLTGGSVGWQAGLQATDVILVFKTRTSVMSLLRGRFTLGADAAAAAGPVGRQLAAATDATLKAEIYSYSRSRGLFAGVSLDGSALQVDANATALYYGSANALTTITQPGLPVQVPPTAAKLLEQIARYTATAPANLGVPAPVSLAPASANAAVAAEAQTVQQQLAQASRAMYGLLDEPWRKFLALPEEVYANDRHPTAETVGQSLVRFEAVARSPHYQLLTQRPEFQTTYGLLRKYHAIQTAQSAANLSLPPPPK